jgi:hypothetical protein
MKRATTLFAIIITALALAVSLPAPAQAASRTWVSGSSGATDANPCTRLAPCVSFSQAISVTDAGGEINCLDAGSFGPVLIIQSVTISCETGTAGVLTSNSTGIAINVASTDIVYLRGLDIEGLNGSNFGINFEGAGTLHIEKCLIRGFNAINGGFGIAFFPGFGKSGRASLFVADTVVTDNGNAGSGGNIIIQPGNSASANVSLERVQMTNGTFGLDADGSNGGFLSVSVADSLASGNVNSGIIAETSSGRTIMMVDRTKSSNNGTYGLKADGANAEMMVGSSTISGNGTGVVIRNGANLFSYQNNQIDLNAVNGTPVPAQSLH